MYCKTEETLLNCDLKPALDKNVGSEKLLADLFKSVYCLLFHCHHVVLLFVFNLILV